EAGHPRDLRSHALERREQVDGGRPCARQRLPRHPESLGRRAVALAAHREGGSVRRRDADRGCAPHGHVADRVGDALGRLEVQPDLLGGGEALGQKAQDPPLPVERAGRNGAGRGGDGPGGGRTTSAAPPLLGSATAVQRPSGPRPSAWTRPIDSFFPSTTRSATVWPSFRSDSAHAASYRPGSICTTSGESCWWNLGAATAASRLSRRSSTPRRTWRFVVGIVEPPGLPHTSAGRPATTAIDGHIEEGIRLPGATALTSPWTSP